MSLLPQLRTLGQYMSADPDFRVGFNGALRLKHVAAVINTAGVVTYTIDQLFGGIILRDPNGGTRTDTTPTAARIVSDLGEGVVVGSSFDVFIRNTGVITEIITLAGGTGVTLSPTTIALDGPNETVHLRFVVTNVLTPAVTIYSLGLDVVST